MSIAIMSQVWSHTPVRDGREIVGLLALADWADDYGGAYPAYDVLAHKMRCSERQAMRVIAALSDAGEVYRLPEKARRKAFFNSNLFVVLSGCKDEADIQERIYRSAKGQGIRIKRTDIPANDLAKMRSDYLASHPLPPPPNSNLEGDTYDTPINKGGDVHDTPEGDTHDTHDLSQMSPNTSLIRHIDTSINGGGNSSLATDNPSPPALLPAAVSETDSTAQRPTAQEIVAPVLEQHEKTKAQEVREYQARESEILATFGRLNTAIRNSNKGYQPITGTRKLAEQLARRGETEASMKAAWETCKTNGIKPMGAFMKWIQEGYLPPQQEGHETQVIDGVVCVWVDGQGWMATGGKAQ